jgi:putative Mn2+ efflux pump MntP
LKDQAPDIPRIVTRTSIIIAKNKDIGPKIAPKKKQETQTKEEQKNNGDYGEAFILALSTSLDDITWYVDLNASLSQT